MSLMPVKPLECKKQSSYVVFMYNWRSSSLYFWLCLHVKLVETKRHIWVHCNKEELVTNNLLSQVFFAAYIWAFWLIEHEPCKSMWWSCPCHDIISGCSLLMGGLRLLMMIASYQLSCIDGILLRNFLKTMPFCYFSNNL